MAPELVMMKEKELVKRYAIYTIHILRPKLRLLDRLIFLVQEWDLMMAELFHDLCGQLDLKSQ